MEVRRAIVPSIQESDDRVPTGVPSLDKIIEGGLRRGDCIIAAGQPGTGKTTLGLQFLYHGATRCGENGVNQAVMIREVLWGKQQLGTNFEEFLGDGLVILDASFDNSRVRRRVYIPKMRGTEHRLEGYDYYITRDGFSLAPTPIPPDKIR